MATLRELWDIYNKLPMLRDYKDVNAFDTAMFAWCINMENKFHELATPENLFNDNNKSEGKL